MPLRPEPRPAGAGRLLWLGGPVGLAWGWLSLAVNRLTGLAQPEAGLGQNLAAFGLAGALTGWLVAGLLVWVGPVLPWRGGLARGAALSVGWWLFLRLGGWLLALDDPQRYHQQPEQSWQGLLLALLLGLLLGAVERTGPSGDSSR